MHTVQEDILPPPARGIILPTPSRLPVGVGRFALPLLVAACTWDAPINDNPLGVPPLLNAIEGTIVFAGEGDLGPTYVTVYDANNPGPPAGTGGPITFSTVPASSYSTTAAGVQSASYSVSQLPDGGFFLNALIDVDGDFNPFAGVLAGATCGDWVGTHLADLSNTLPAVVPVEGGIGRTDITIVVGAQLATERPVFELLSDPAISLGAAATSPIPALFRIGATAINTAFSEEVPLSLGPACLPEADLGAACAEAPACPCEDEAPPPCATTIPTWLVDADADGVVDPYPAEQQAAAGLLDIWPRTYLEYVGEPLEAFEHDGQLVPERWVAEAFPLAAEIGGTALYTTLPPGEAAAVLFPDNVGIPFDAAELSITFAPLFVHYHADGQAGVDANGPFDVVDLTAPDAVIDDVPLGAYAVTLITHTGQTWTLPNEVGLNELPPLAGTDLTPQGAALVLGP